AHLAPLRDRHRDRLLAQHVLAGGDGGERDGVMDAVGRRDLQPIDALVARDLQRIGRGAAHPGGLRAALERHRVDVAQGDDAGVGAERDAGNVVGERDAAGADERDPYHRALLYPSALTLQVKLYGHRHDHRYGDAAKTRRRVAPLLHRVERGAIEQRHGAQDPRVAYGAVDGNDRFDDHDALDAGALRELRVSGCHVSELARHLVGTEPNRLLWRGLRRGRRVRAAPPRPPD